LQSIRLSGSAPPSTEARQGEAKRLPAIPNLCARNATGPVKIRELAR
jgi:hypothetical protein